MEVTGKVLIGNLLLGLAILKSYGCQDVFAEWEIGDCVYLEIPLPDGIQVSAHDREHLELMGWITWGKSWRIEWAMTEAH